MSESMVEQVARAICPKVMLGGMSWDTVGEGGQAFLLGIARTAIEAMREPTGAMIRAGGHVWDDDWCAETNVLNIWQASIDEALR